jgi:hypothetical protein
MLFDTMLNISHVRYVAREIWQNVETLFYLPDVTYVAHAKTVENQFLEETERSPIVQPYSPLALQTLVW